MVHLSQLGQSVGAKHDVQKHAVAVVIPKKYGASRVSKESAVTGVVSSSTVRVTA